MAFYTLVRSMTIQFDQTRYLTSAAAPRDLPPDTGAEVALTGRSNAGKSSVINAICRRKHLARSGKTPGVTRMINFFETQPRRYLVDLPGYGYAHTSKAQQLHWQTLMEHYFKKRKALCGIILAVDIRRSLTELDKRLLDWCPKRPLLILLTKRDKLGGNRTKRAYEDVRAILPDAIEVLPFSRNDASDAEQVRDMITCWWSRTEARTAAAKTTKPAR